MHGIIARMMSTPDTQGGRGGSAAPAPRWRVAPPMILAVGLLVIVCAMLAGCGPFGGGSTSQPAHQTSAQSTPTSAVQGQLAHAVYLNVWGLGVQSLQTSYDPTQAIASVTITLGGSVPGTDVMASAAEELTKAFCLMALQALWTSNVSLSETKVVVQGPIQDEYADIITQPYGVVTLEASVAQKIDWKTVSADQAWQAYDHEFLRDSFVLSDSVPGAP
jgi:hypothetical protein